MGRGLAGAPPAGLTRARRICLTLCNERRGCLKAPRALEAIYELGIRNPREPHQDRRPALVVVRLEIDFGSASIDMVFSSTVQRNTSVSGSLTRIRNFPRTFMAGVPKETPSSTSGSFAARAAARTRAKARAKSRSVLDAALPVTSVREASRRFADGFEATFSQAVASASLIADLSAAASNTLVVPLRPHPPPTGVNTSGFAATNFACCTGLSLTRAHPASGYPLVPHILPPTHH